MDNKKLIERLSFETRLGNKDIPVEDVMQLVMADGGWISAHDKIPEGKQRELPVDVILDDGRIGEAFYAPDRHKITWLYREKHEPPYNAIGPFRNIMYTGRHVKYWRPYQPQPLPAAADGLVTIQVTPGSYVIPPGDVETIRIALKGYLDVIKQQASQLPAHNQRTADAVTHELERLISKLY